jgi:hypothetical protein
MLGGQDLQCNDQFSFDFCLYCSNEVRLCGPFIFRPGREAEAQNTSIDSCRDEDDVTKMQRCIRKSALSERPLSMLPARTKKFAMVMQKNIQFQKMFINKNALPKIPVPDPSDEGQVAEAEEVKANRAAMQRQKGKI